MNRRSRKTPSSGPAPPPLFQARAVEPADDIVDREPGYFRTFNQVLSNGRLVCIGQSYPISTCLCPSVLPMASRQVGCASTWHVQRSTWQVGVVLCSDMKTEREKHRVGERTTRYAAYNAMEWNMTGTNRLLGCLTAHQHMIVISATIRFMFSKGNEHQ